MLLGIVMHNLSCGYFFFNSYEYIPKSGIAGPCGNSMVNILRNFQTIFQTVNYFIFSPAICEGPNFSTFLSTVNHTRTHPFFSLSQPGECKVDFNVILICIPLLANYVDHLFICISQLYIFLE